MTERVPLHDWEATLRVDHDGFLDDAYRLLTIFLASPAIASLDSSSPQRHPNRQINEWALLGIQREVPNLLLRLAATIRAKDDDGSWLPRMNSNVGELIEDVEGNAPAVSLTIREACNKILHNDRTHFDLEIHEKTGAEYAKPTVYLYGQRRDKKWRATLDVVAFCCEAQNVIY